MIDFIIIVAPRCGTTSLYNYLVSHPKIIPATEKEIHFFDMKFAKGTKWYFNQFPSLTKTEKKTRLVTGEATPAYLAHPDVPKRIRDVLPNIKFLVLLRNPVDRALSHYKMSFRLGNEKLSFSEAIKRQSKGINSVIKKMFSDGIFYESNRKDHRFLIKGIYIRQLENWFKFFNLSK